MSELLSSITGGGGGFVSKFASALISLSAGQSGTYITLTPPTGQKVRLTALGSGGSKHTDNVTITVGGVDIHTGGNIDQVASTINPTSSGEIVIGFINGNQDFITGDVDEVLEIKTGTTTSAVTVYTYQFGE